MISKHELNSNNPAHKYREYFSKYGKNFNNKDFTIFIILHFFILTENYEIYFYGENWSHLQR